MNADAASQWRQAKNILCVRLDYLGDVLMCTPAMRAIKESQPGRAVTLLTSNSGAAVAPFVPEIDDVISYAAPWLKSSVPHRPMVDIDFIHTLQCRKFDAAVIFTSYSQSALPTAMLCYLADIPLRLAHCRENPYQMLTDWVPETEPHTTLRHEVRRQLDLVEIVGYRTTNEKLSFSVKEGDARWVKARLCELGAELTRPWVLMHPGATAASRRYPVDHWSNVIEHLTTTLGYSVVLTGDSSEVELVNEIRQHASSQAYSLAGELDLGKLGAVISMASVVISNNTGPAHMAAALGTPVVDLYALTNPQHTPWQVESRVLFHDVPCRFCYKSICPQGHHDCLDKVEPARVIEAAQSLLFIS